MLVLSSDGWKLLLLMCRFSSEASAFPETTHRHRKAAAVLSGGSTACPDVEVKEKTEASKEVI